MSHSPQAAAASSIVVKGKPIGLIYADRPGPGDITIPEKKLSLLKSLRNQAVLAIRQSL